MERRRVKKGLWGTLREISNGRLACEHCEAHTASHERLSLIGAA